MIRRHLLPLGFVVVLLLGFPIYVHENLGHGGWTMIEYEALAVLLVLVL